MEPKEIKEWALFVFLVIGWVVSATTIWNKLIERVNGLGSRVAVLKTAYSETEGKVERIEREILGYRSDAHNVASALGRVERASDEIAHKIEESAKQLDSRIYNLEKLINEKDTRARERLVRLETVAAIEKKIGPIPGG